MKLDSYNLISPYEEITDFIRENDNTQIILETIKPHLTKHFPNSLFSLEICDKLDWTTETKLLVNVKVTEEMFFNGLLNHFNDIYERIYPLIEDVLCPIVLFPDLSNESYDKFGSNCSINLIARTAYFNHDFDRSLQSEMTLREIPKPQMKREILEYCKKHPKPDLSDIVYDLQLDLFDVDSIIDEIESSGVKLNVRW
ncbi:MAG: hypothetical protein IK021_04425 [Methanobrevibacter sp.]|nr:hypothetical protein [Methanobrevibacter sp.]